MQKPFRFTIVSVLVFLLFTISGCGTDETCIDGIQNQDETAVDCGGICQACISCSDGIQNGGETGVDCGGNCPDVCSIVENLQNFTPDNSDLPSGVINDLELVGNVLWVATPSGAASYDGDTWTIYNTSNSGLPSNDVRAIHSGIVGDLWFTTFGGGVANLDNGTWTVWNSSVAGVPAEIDNVEGIAQAINWTVVVAPNAGFLIWDGTTWTEYTTTNSSLPSDQLTGIASGPNAEFYFSTEDAGLLKFDFPGFTGFNTSNSDLPGNNLTSVIHAGNAELWIGSEVGLVFKSGNSWTNYQTSNSDIPGNQVKTLYHDIDDNIWLAAPQLTSFDGNSWTVYTSENSDPGLSLAEDMVIDGNGRHWVGTSGSGIFAFD